MNAVPPQLPPKPPLPPEDKPNSWLSTLFALLLLGGVVVGLLLVSLGSIFGALLLLLLVLPVIALAHYLLWGWWLGRLIESAVREEEE